MFFMFAESALKNVKSLKQRCSALITSGASTRVACSNFIHFHFSVMDSIEKEVEREAVRSAIVSVAELFMRQFKREAKVKLKESFEFEDVSTNVRRINSNIILNFATTRLPLKDVTSMSLAPSI